MKKQSISFILVIFLLTSVSAIYGGETEIIPFDFEPVACSVTDNLTFNINSNNVVIDVPINFVGNFTLTCFSGEESNPVIVYRGGGGSRTKYIYENVTEYKDKVVEIEKIVEVEGETKIEEKIIKAKSRLGNKGKILVGFLIGIIVLLFVLYITKNSKKENFHNNVTKEDEI